MDKLNVTLTHLNVRQSIIILIAKLITTDVLLAIVVIGLYLLYITGTTISNLIIIDPLVFFIIFLIAGFVKIFLTTYVVLLWLYEYYEITAEHIIHKKGIIFQKTEQYRIDHIRRIDVQDTFFGELFNYATISIFDIRLNKLMDMVLVHNPNRYARVLRELKPDLETEKERTELPFLPKDEDNAELED